MPRILFTLLLVLLCASGARAAERFSFEGVKSVPDMKKMIEENLPLGTKREEVQRIFVLQGRATLRNHPEQVNVEKYLYDINLCNYYIFRWNISADYKDDGTLWQIYINGIAVYPEGKPKPKLPEPAAGNRSRIIKTAREWPQATKGGRRLSYLLYDNDGNTQTIDDQRVMGLGATKADPVDFGAGIRYSDVELWRSIYDEDLSNDIASYPGSCKAADTKYLSRDLFEPRHGFMP